MQLDDIFQHLDRGERLGVPLPILDVVSPRLVDIVFSDKIFDLVEEIAHVEAEDARLFSLQQILEVLSPTLSEGVVNNLEYPSKVTVRLKLFCDDIFKPLLLEL